MLKDFRSVYEIVQNEIINNQNNILSDVMSKDPEYMATPLVAKKQSNKKKPLGNKPGAEPRS